MLLEKIRDFIRKYNLILPGETVQVGFSGGADSVCLLLLLSELGKQQGFSVQAVHVNHCLRGEESDRDQRFAEEFCRIRNIPLFCESYPVQELALERKTGIEEAGREARRLAFEKYRQQEGAKKTALAHHRNDQAETVLFRLARGSSIGGLSGIRPMQGEVIHPLLFADKREILQELDRRGIDYCTDSSNLTDHYTRNCIRLHVMPELEEKVNERAAAHIAEAAEDMAEADVFLKKLAAPAYQRCIREEQGGIFVSEELLEEEAVLRKYVLMDALSLAAGGRKNLGREQVRQLESLLKGTAGRKQDLPGGLEAVRSYPGLLIRKKKDSRQPEQEASEQSSIRIEGPGIYTFGRWTLSCTLLPSVPAEIPEKTFTKWLDYDKIKHALEFRNRRPGDFLAVTPEGGRKKLKSYLIDEKIPADRRGEIPLLASGSRIFWVVGLRISEDCKVSEQTERVLKITVSEDSYE